MLSLQLQVAVMDSQALTVDDLTCIRENTRADICTEEVINGALEQNVS